jgi:hypothetical protein
MMQNFLPKVSLQDDFHATSELGKIKVRPIGHLKEAFAKLEIGTALV